CTCKEIRRAEMMFRKSGISEEFAKKTFHNFDFSRNIQVLNAYTKSIEYTKNFNSIKSTRKNSIILMGSVGGGKSHLSFAIANELMKNSVGVIYMGYRETVMKIKQNIMNMENYDKLMSTYKNCKVLLVDDLFKGNITSSDLNIFFEIVNHRYFNNLPMIISTEILMSDLLKIDEAIGSRIMEMCADYSIELKGSKLNYRIYG
ncbi:ATP-binding protein, partial [Terrisporobacter sp.]|uniref:ATP-binding protein n=1 Tax=Terrisporobacter sp. TaxID=1965305 RepID=UPI00260D8C98